MIFKFQVLSCLFLYVGISQPETVLALKKPLPQVHAGLRWVEFATKRGLVRVAGGDSIELSYGEYAEIKSVEPSNPSLSIHGVNVIGFSSERAPLPYDDRNQKVIYSEIDQRWAIYETDSHSVFQAKAFTKSGLIGSVFIKLRYPKFEYLEIWVDNVVNIVRPGQSLELSKNSQLKFKSVRWKPRVLDDKDTTVKVVKEKNTLAIGLFHGKRRLAKIPVKLKAVNYSKK